MHSNKLVGGRFGTRVVVFGAGPVGLLSAVARAFGASDVIFVDVFDNKLQRAKDFGATGTFNSSKFSVDEAQQLSDELEKLLSGHQADVVFECSGADICIEAGVKTTKVGGTMVQVGMGKTTPTF